MPKSTIGPLDITYNVALGRVRECDTWTRVQMPKSATVFGTRGRVKVAGTTHSAEPAERSWICETEREDRERTAWRPIRSPVEW